MAKCKICGKEFASTKSLGAHSKGSHYGYNKVEFKFFKKECLFCGKEFEVKRSKKRDGSFHQRKKEKKFCSSKCANNREFSQETKNKIRVKLLKNKFCKKCGKDIVLEPCDCNSLIVEKNKYITKGDLFKFRKNWQSARTEFRKVAIKNSANLEKKCFICGYAKHVEICHKKSVSSFDDNSLIEEISSEKNLVMLCPNHHWEFDNDLIDL